MIRDRKYSSSILGEFLTEKCTKWLNCTSSREIDGRFLIRNLGSYLSLIVAIALSRFRDRPIHVGHTDRLTINTYQ